MNSLSHSFTTDIDITAFVKKVETKPEHTDEELNSHVTKVHFESAVDTTVAIEMSDVSSTVSLDDDFSLDRYVIT